MMILGISCKETVAIDKKLLNKQANIKLYMCHYNFHFYPDTTRSEVLKKKSKRGFETRQV